MDESKFLTKTDFNSFQDQLWKRFDYNDSLSRKTGERMAVVESRLDNQSANTKKTAAGWGAGVGTAAAGFVYGLFTLWKGHGQ